MSVDIFMIDMSCVSAGRLRVNMGNIYFEQKKYPQAIKQYRMALDQVPNTHKDMRYNVGREMAACALTPKQFNGLILGVKFR